MIRCDFSVRTNYFKSLAALTVIIVICAPVLVSTYPLWIRGNLGNTSPWCMTNAHFPWNFKGLPPSK